MAIEQKKGVAIISTSGGYAKMINVPGARFFVPESLFNKRRRNFLAGLYFAGKVDARSTLNIVTHLENAIKFKLKDKTINIRRDDFILPKYITKTGWVVFDHHTFFLEDNSVAARIKKYIEPPDNRVKYNYQEQKLDDDFLVTKAERDIKKIYFKAHVFYIIEVTWLNNLL